ncbi:MAG: hypothetical protein ACKOAY_01525 [Haliscomenobacter sp.]
MSVSEDFSRLENELRPFLPILGQAADTVIDENVSSYPIFVASQLEIELGILLIPRMENRSKWFIHASTLEEMSAKKVIQEDKVNSFRQIYKNAREYVCLFVLSDLGAKFIFLPRVD